MNNSALLIMDVQNITVASCVKDESALQPFQNALAVARRHQIPVIHVRAAFRPGYPEIHSRNKMFSSFANWVNATNSETALEIHKSVAPTDDELIVNKLRTSAFSGNDLEIILRSKGINTLILAGIATSGVVLSTLREASDKDFMISVLSDACIDPDPEVKQLLIQKVFPIQAEVITVEAWKTSLR